MKAVIVKGIDIELHLDVNDDVTITKELIESKICLINFVLSKKMDNLQPHIVKTDNYETMVINFK